MKARMFAANAHASIDQRRKYTRDPYIVHPTQVAYLVSLVSLNEDTISAAYLHDVLEDVAPINAAFSEEKMRLELGDKITNLVLELTDISKPSDGNREARKEIDRLHYANASISAKTIKLADLIDNTQTIVTYDPGFAKIYLKEKALLLPLLKDGDPVLYALAQSTLILSHKKLGIK